MRLRRLLHHDGIAARRDRRAGEDARGRARRQHGRPLAGGDAQGHRQHARQCRDVGAAHRVAVHLRIVQRRHVDQRHHGSRQDRARAAARGHVLRLGDRSRRPQAGARSLRPGSAPRQLQGVGNEAGDRLDVVQVQARQVGIGTVGAWLVGGQRDAPRRRAARGRRRRARRRRGAAPRCSRCPAGREIPPAAPGRTDRGARAAAPGNRRPPRARARPSAPSAAPTPPSPVPRRRHGSDTNPCRADRCRNRGGHA